MNTLRRPGLPAEWVTPQAVKKAATEAQKVYLRDLCMEQDGEVDEDWLNGLTVAEASDEIKTRAG